MRYENYVMNMVAIKRTQNPFIIRGYAGPEYFCDREEETASLMSALDAGRDVVLVSPRRIGKTGLIHHLFHNLRRQSDIYTFYLDIFPTQNLSEFVQLFGETVLGRLDAPLEKAMQRVMTYVHSLVPKFSADPLTGSPVVSLDVAERDNKLTLREIFDYLKSSEKECYIAIDEFQQINEYPEKGVEALLRSYIQFLPNVHFIFAGSRQHMLQDMFLLPKRPFYQSAQVMNLQPLDREAYYRFCASKCLTKELFLDQDVFNALYDRYSGYTWYIQQVMNRLYQYEVSPVQELVDAAVREIVEEQADAYARLFNVLPSGCRRLLKAVSREGAVTGILSGSFIARHNLKAASSVQASLRKLTEIELVSKTADGYVISDRFMADWLRTL